MSFRKNKIQRYFDLAPVLLCPDVDARLNRMWKLFFKLTIIKNNQLERMPFSFIIIQGKMLVCHRFKVN